MIAGPLRFLYVHPLALPGVEANLVQTVETCRALAAQGNEVFLVVPKIKAASAREALAAYGLEEHENLSIVPEPLIRLTKSSGWRSYVARVQLFLFLASLTRRGRTVLYFRTLRDAKLARFLLLAARLLRVPAIYEAHKIYTEKRADQGFGADTLGRHERLESRVFARAAGIVASHPILEERLRATMRPLGPMVTAPNGVPVLERAGAERAVDAIYAGSLFPWKDVDICIEALARGRDSTLAVVGGNPPERLEQLRRKAADLGVQDRVTFHGLKGRTETLAMLGTARAALVPVDPASGEGERYTCPLKMLEAMMRGVAVIAADTPALRAFVRHEVTALLVPRGDAAALAAAIHRLRDDAGLRGRLETAARAEALRFGFDQRARTLAAFARELNQMAGPA